MHRSGTQVITSILEEELKAVAAGDTGITWFLGRLAGSIDGTPFAAQMRYTRTWVFGDERGWRIIAAHASMTPPA